MTVVTDTSPVNYLVQIGCSQFLPALFVHVSALSAVLKELRHRATPELVRSFANDLPEWISVREIRLTPDSELAGLHPGEREAIQLALEERADFLLMDERSGAGLASRRGLTVIGTLGVLVRAAEAGLANIDTALGRLRGTDFRCTPQLLEHARRMVHRAHP